MSALARFSTSPMTPGRFGNDSGGHYAGGFASSAFAATSLSTPLGGWLSSMGVPSVFRPYRRGSHYADTRMFQRLSESWCQNRSPLPMQKMFQGSCWPHPFLYDAGKTHCYFEFSFRKWYHKTLGIDVHEDHQDFLRRSSAISSKKIPMSSPKKKSR